MGMIQLHFNVFIVNSNFVYLSVVRKKFQIHDCAMNRTKSHQNALMCQVNHLKLGNRKCQDFSLSFSKNKHSYVTRALFGQWPFRLGDIHKVRKRYFSNPLESVRNTNFSILMNNTIMKFWKILLYFWVFKKHQFSKRFAKNLNLVSFLYLPFPKKFRG